MRIAPSAPWIARPADPSLVGLRAWWPLGGGDGRRVVDVAGSAFEGTITSPGPTWTASQDGWALSWNGTQSHRVEAPGTPITGTEMQQGFFVSAYVVVQSDATIRTVLSLIPNVADAGANGTFALRVDASGNLSILRNNIGSATFAAGAVPIGVPVHLVGGYDGANVVGFIDGAQVVNSATTLNAADAVTAWIGDRNSGTNQTFNGLISDVRVYSGIPTVERVAQTRDAGARALWPERGRLLRMGGTQTAIGGVKSVFGPWKFSVGSPGAAADTIVLPFLDSSAQLFAPTLSPGPVGLTLPLLASTATLFPPTITTGTTLVLPLIGSTAQLFPPTLSPGPVGLTLPLIGSTAVLYPPTLVQAGGPPQSLTLPLIASTAALFAPSVALAAIGVGPQVTGAVVSADGLELVIAFDRIVSTATPLAGWSVTADGDPVELAAAFITDAGRSITLVPAAAILADQTVLLSYSTS